MSLDLKLGPDGVARWTEEDAGSATVSCVLGRDASFDVRTVGDHPILWDALYDNLWEFNSLSEIPDGLGLNFAFDGTSAEITVAESGVWALTYTLGVQQDDAWKGSLDTRFGHDGLTGNVRSGESHITALTLALPAGITFDPRISATVQATSNPYSCPSAYLAVSRLG